MWVFPHALANYLYVSGEDFSSSIRVLHWKIYLSYFQRNIYIYVYTNTEELDYTLYYELTYMYPS